MTYVIQKTHFRAYGYHENVFARFKPKYEPNRVPKEINFYSPYSLLFNFCFQLMFLGKMMHYFNLKLSEYKRLSAEESLCLDCVSRLKVVSIIENSIKTGLAGTTYEDRILPQQSHLIDNAKKRNKILQNSIINQIIANVSAIMESKSAMEVVVANPTAGSCGVVGGVLRAVADDIDASHDELIKAYFATGIIGVYFAMGPGFSAEEHGCQVECGASAGMAAAGIVQLFGGTARQAVDAASMAIQNMIGLVCDPIADRVEAPCLGKNISAAVNALSSATMSCAGYNALIPLNEVLKTVSSVSSQMPTCVKCTGKGGLATTSTACAIKEKLALKSTIATV